MKPLGWIIMSVSLLLVWGATFWSFYRVLSAPREEDTTKPPVGLGA